eukprot:scaffold79076_cov44-Prasinocladus_malaysianus.AAC.2
MVVFTRAACLPGVQIKSGGLERRELSFQDLATLGGTLSPPERDPSFAAESPMESPRLEGEGSMRGLIGSGSMFKPSARRVSGSPGSRLSRWVSCLPACSP